MDPIWSNEYGGTARCAVPECKGLPGTLGRTIAHEMAHCCGLDADGNLFGGNNGVGDCIADCLTTGMSGSEC